MPRLQSDRPYEPSRPDPRLNRLLGQWLLLGVLIAALFPAARGYSELIGWLPLWLLGAPLVSLMVLHRQRIWIGPSTASQRPSTGGLARRQRGAAHQARRANGRRGRCGTGAGGPARIDGSQRAAH